MDVQSIANALLLVPAVVLGVVAVRARRAGRTRLGLDPRDGAATDLLRGIAFGAVAIALLVAVLAVFGAVEVRGTGPLSPELIGIAVYFLVLFLVEEIVFRALLMTGLGVLCGQLAALLVTSVLVAIPYAFATGSGVLPVLGAVATNVVNGLARWRTGRIWFGLGMRWAWNTLQIAFGVVVSGYTLAAPVVDLETVGPAWLTGATYGPEGGIPGIAVRVVMVVALVWLIGSRTGPWTISPPGRVRSGPAG